MIRLPDLKKRNILNKSNWLLCSFCLAGLVTIPFILHADQPESTIYFVRCDNNKQEITVAEKGFMPSLDDQVSKKEVSEFTINPGILTKIGGTEDDPLILPEGQKTYEWRLGKTFYHIVIEPRMFPMCEQWVCVEQQIQVYLFL